MRTPPAAPAPAPPALHVERRSIDDAVVSEAWRRLQAAGGVEVPFLTYEWATSLSDAELCPRLAVLAVFRGTEALGLFPIEWSRGFHHRAGRSSSQLVTIGPAAWQWSAPDHLDVVALPEDRSAAAGAITAHLMAAGDWDGADFQGLSADGALARAVAAAMRAPRFAVARREACSPIVTLAGRSEHELLPSRNLRQQIRRGLRVAERSGGGLEVVGEPDRLAGLLADMMRLHNDRFGARSRVFATSARRSFHLLAAQRLAAAGMARMYRLHCDGGNAGLLYTLRFGPRLYYYSMGIDPDRGLSPGRTVLGQAVLSAAGEGFEEFDLLRGEHEFKRRFADRDHVDVKLRALRLTPRNALLASPLLGRRLLRRRSNGRPDNGF